MRTPNEILISLLLDWAEETCGTVDDIGFYGIIRTPIMPDEFQGDDEIHASWLGATDGLRDDLDNLWGPIIRQDDQGFLQWRFYGSEEDMCEAWLTIESEHAAFCEKEN